MISKDKQYRTRDGREVRIYATDGVEDWPIHGAYKHYDSYWWPVQWRKNGTHFNDCLDLIEVKPRIKRTVWLNVYDNEVIHGGWRTKEEADDISHRNRVACIKLDLDFEKGEGL